MKFLVDAQLPYSLAKLIRELGHDAAHCLDLPDGNQSSDKTLNEISVKQERILITKDNDFIHSFLLTQKPYKLLYVSTGNISNRLLLEKFKINFSELLFLFQAHQYLEFSEHNILVHN